MERHSFIEDVFSQLRAHDSTYQEILEKEETLRKEVPFAETQPESTSSSTGPTYADCADDESTSSEDEQDDSNSGYESIGGQKLLKRFHKSFSQVVSPDVINSIRAVAPQLGGVLDHWEKKFYTSLGSEEKILAYKLHRCCDSFGREKRDKLEQSAGYLLELGELHMDIAIAEDGVKQKLEFVRSAALIVGALVRYQILKKPEKYKSAKITLQKLHSEIMKNNNVENYTNVDILEVSKEMKRTIKTYRANIAEKLERVTKVPDEKSDEDILYEVQQKISQVRKISEECSDYYLDVMHKIAGECETIMGKPPCRYAIVGLGSLARKEATMYSDFEHAILLEDGTDGDASIKEYFRWFSTIFHVIVIGLGETVIPSVNVKCLSDQYSDNIEDKWFSDEYTPCGISFDGMMPHACKIPLGRQPTKLRIHSVELIQPVSKMANFLTKEEELKNGYFLSDILNKVSFVWGRREFFNHYLSLRKCHELLRFETQKDIGEQQLNIIRSNPNKAIKESDVYNLVTNGKVKTATYRPLTALLACAAALYGITAQSSFEIVDEMKSAGFIDSDTHHRLMFALAVTMEVRMKTYKIAGHQRKNLTFQETINLVGRESLINCFTVIYLWRKVVLADIFRSLKGIEIVGQRALRNIEKDTEILGQRTLGSGGDVFDENTFILLLFKNYEEVMTSAAKEIVQIVNKYRKSVKTAVEVKWFLKKQFISLLECFPWVYTDTGKFINDEAFKAKMIFQPHVQNWKWLCELLLKFLHDDDFHANEVAHFCLFEIYRAQGKPQHALEANDKAWEFHKKRIEMGQLSTEMSLIQYRSYFNNMLPVVGGEGLMQRIEKLMLEETNYTMLCMMRIGKCYALGKKGLRQAVRDQLLALLTDIEENAQRLGKFSFHYLLAEILKIQNSCGLDSLHTLTLISETYSGQAPVNELRFPLEDEEARLKYMNPGTRLETHSIVNDVSVDGLKIMDTKTNKDDSIDWMNAKTKNPGYLRVLSTYSYREMIQEINSAMEQWQSDKRSSAVEIASCTSQQLCCLIVLCENVRCRDLNVPICWIRKCLVQVRSQLLLQPFLYACLYDVVHYRLPFLATSTREQIMGITSEQQDVFKSLFRPVIKSQPLRLAIDYFVNLKFKSCATLSWKMLHYLRDDCNSFLRRYTIKLFLITLLAMIVIRKRRDPLTCFRKTREISVRQITYCTSKSFAPIVSRICSFGQYDAYCYDVRFNGQKFVQVFNLAVILSWINLPKSAALLWKSICAPNVPSSVRKKILEALYTAVLSLMQLRELAKVDPSKLPSLSLLNDIDEKLGLTALFPHLFKIVRNFPTDIIKLAQTGRLDPSCWENVDTSFLDNIDWSFLENTDPEIMKKLTLIIDWITEDEPISPFF